MIKVGTGGQHGGSHGCRRCWYVADRRGAQQPCLKIAKSSCPELIGHLLTRSGNVGASYLVAHAVVEVLEAVEGYLWEAALGLVLECREIFVDRYTQQLGFADDGAAFNIKLCLQSGQRRPGS